MGHNNKPERNHRFVASDSSSSSSFVESDSSSSSFVASHWTGLLDWTNQCLALTSSHGNRVNAELQDAKQQVASSKSDN